MLTIVLDKDLECTIVYVRCDSGYDGYHETHLMVTVYSELVPSQLGRQNILRDSGAVITWESFCEVFRQENTLYSFYNSRERVFDNLKQGSMRVAELIGGRSNLVVDLIRHNLPSPTVKCRFPRETGRSQAPRRQQDAKEQKNFFPEFAKISNSTTTSLSLNSSTQVSKLVSIKNHKEDELSDTNLTPNSGVNRRQSTEKGSNEHKSYSESQSPTNSDLSAIQILALTQICLRNAILAHDQQKTSCYRKTT
ncbi:hypothetical protein F511_29392 [Dorcoceras hygrometricum]|uniref:Uncharacterized protein n=1 Tax=Dorcoceras hygrometricum TaxID=472368 RepID=A0A2Z7CGM4_9LAMI|nr:hypothetical protein F511_29392 [Dorcoceras hygrometricum]